ncbi:MAG: TolC family protein, partial [Candidatus Omnitrophica bacterium]|nr:TolC family protein [Candidatus Omnitrophota bacterium]
MIDLSKNTVKLLKLFYAHPDDAFYIQQIGRILKKKPGVFQRMLYKLEKQGVLKSEYQANARFFRANKEYPIYKELKSILSKTSIISIALILLLGAFKTPSGLAEEAAPRATVLFSLKDAVEIAYKNNKEIQMQDQAIKTARANILGARSIFLPDINFDTSYTRNGAVVPSTTATTSLKKDYGVFVGYQNDNRTGVTLGQTIYNGGANIANLRQMEIGLKEQEETLRATKLNVELEAKRLYYGLLLAYETKRIAEDLVVQAKSHYDNVRKKFEQGTASKFDALQSKVQISLLVPELINAITSIDLIKAELNKLLGLKIQEDVLVQDKLGYVPIEVRESEFLKEALLYRPEMILQSFGIDMNKWAVKFAKAGWLPQVNANADYYYRSNNWSNMFNSRHNNWNVGVAVSVPIFDGFATKAKVDAARANLVQSMISKENYSDQTTVDVKSSCLDLARAQSVIDAQKDNLEDAREALKSAEVRYDNGIGVNLDVLDAQVSLAQVEE